MTEERWRTVDHLAVGPAHLIRTAGETACGWTPSAGVLHNRAQLLASTRYACTACLRHAKRVDQIAAQNAVLAGNNFGGRA